MTPSTESVIAASNAWQWVPDNAVTVETDEYLLVRFPDYFDHPLELSKFHPTGPVKDAVATVLDRARQFGLPHLYWMERLDSPAEVAELLTARGATIVETLDVVAFSLNPEDANGVKLSGGEAGEADGTVGATGLELRWATDIATARDAAALDAEVFGGSLPPEDQLAKYAEEYRATVPAGEGGLLVAYLDGAPVGAGGVKMVEDVARLWGAGVKEEVRHRGVYRTILATRLAYAAAHGATMALTKARVQTSGPILRRVGFAAYGQERFFRVPLT